MGINKDEWLRYQEEMAEDMKPEPKKKRKYPEFELQKTCNTWFRLQYPRVIAFHPSNGFGRSKAESGIAKAMGQLAGIPDYFIMYPTKTFHGLVVEFKIGTERPRENQQKILDTLASYGYATAVCNSLDVFMEAVRTYMET